MFQAFAHPGLSKNPPPWTPGGILENLGGLGGILEFGRFFFGSARCPEKAWRPLKMGEV